MSDANWEKLFDSWQAPEEGFKLRLDRYCEVCGANKPIELHETWCPNEPDRISKDDAEFWLRDDETCSCSQCTDLNSPSLPAPAGQMETAFTSGFFEDWQTPYHAPEPPVGEDWILRDACLGIGGAPTRATTLPDSAAERKGYPVASGVLDYFPDALVAISNLSHAGNEQHNPGQPLHWDRTKSGDEADTMIRHFLQRGTFDVDGKRHSVKMAWRALAILQKEIEGER